MQGNEKSIVTDKIDYTINLPITVATTTALGYLSSIP